MIYDYFGKRVKGLYPVGAIIPSATACLRPGWQWCSGQLAYKTDYPALFDVVGYTFGGSGTWFLLPNLSNKVPLGSGQGSGLTNRAFNSSGGEITHFLYGGASLPELPAHDHVVNDSHRHSVPGGWTSAESAGITMANTGGTDAHNNMQPWRALTYIIKATKRSSMVATKFGGYTEDAPIGFVCIFSSQTAPAGWLACDGSALDSNQYVDLYNAIGTTFGGIGSNFNLPDMRGRTAINASGSRPVGNSSGQESVQLTIPTMPSHNHTNNNGPAPHAHGYQTFMFREYTLYGYIGRCNVTDQVYDVLVGGNPLWNWMFGQTGGTQVHNNMMPWVRMNYLIRAG